MANVVVARTALDELEDGNFKRTDAGFRSFITPGGQYPPEAGRYHLYVSYACPWAHRTLIVRAMKGLDKCISVSVVHPVWQKTRPNDPKDTHTGWVFANKAFMENQTPMKNTNGRGSISRVFADIEGGDPHNDAPDVRTLYELSNDTTGKYSVPVLWDIKTKTIVNNESSEIIEIFNSAFNEFATNPTLDLSPVELKAAMDDVDSWVYPNINNGVYKCGFATTQEAYDKAIDELTAGFDKAEALLRTQPFLTGSQLTMSDIRLFVTLVRFDKVYIVYFKCNTRAVEGSAPLLDFCRRVYQTPGVMETLNMAHIQNHYFASHPNLNYSSIVPRGRDFETLLSQPPKTLCKI